MDNEEEFNGNVYQGPTDEDMESLASAEENINEQLSQGTSNTTTTTSTGSSQAQLIDAGKFFYEQGQKEIAEVKTVARNVEKAMRDDGYQDFSSIDTCFVTIMSKVVAEFLEMYKSDFRSLCGRPLYDGLIYQFLIALMVMLDLGIAPTKYFENSRDDRQRYYRCKELYGALEAS